MDSFLGGIFAFLIGVILSLAAIGGFKIFEYSVLHVVMKNCKNCEFEK